MSGDSTLVLRCGYRSQNSKLRIFQSCLLPMGPISLISDCTSRRSLNPPLFAGHDDPFTLPDRPLPVRRNAAQVNVTALQFCATVSV
jgi:hypothetical protein